MKSVIVFTLLLLTPTLAMAQACPDIDITQQPKFFPPVAGEIVSGFGSRQHPILGTMKFHPGIDYALPLGEPVRAAAAGKVLIADYKVGYDKYVRLAHARGFESAYAHLSAITVKSGDCVKTGDIIGRSGETGAGPHLHFEMLARSRFIDPRRNLEESGPKQ